MGFCVDGDNQYDVFFSYAHSDNNFHNKWVSDFEEYLEDKVRAALERKVDDKIAALFKVCRDETNFPESGNVEATIDKKVRQSQILFIFLGEKYVKSEWCLSELNIFREKIGGVSKEALDHLYLIVLDSKLCISSQDRATPDKLPPQCEKLWNKLYNILDKSFRKENFLRSGSLLPVFQTRDPPHAHTDFHQVCLPLVDELANKLTDYRKKFHSENTVTKDENSASHILIGAVPKRLETARNALAQTLRDKNVHTIKEDDLVAQNRDNLCNLFKETKLLVQPFDHYEPLWCQRADDPSGGHLALQKQLFEESLNCEAHDSDAPIIWWEPSSCETNDALPISPRNQNFIDNLPRERIKRCSAQEIAAILLPADRKTPLATSSVWIECEKSDKEAIIEARNIIREQFEKYCEQKSAERINLNTVVQFGIAEWEVLKIKMEGSTDGVVIVDNENKDIKSVVEKEEAISNKPEVYQKKTIFPGIFCMRPEGNYHPSDWGILSFTVLNHQLIREPDPNEMEAFVSKLFEVLYNKYR